MNIAKTIEMGVTEVTQEQYVSVMGQNPSRLTDCPDCPVETVNWYDANEFCGKLTARNRAAGKIGAKDIYRLPTEAQWEYACRAGTDTRFWFEDALECNDTALNCPLLNQNVWWGGNWEVRDHPVGQKPANPWGLLDMAGNVLEWCQDWFADYPKKEATDPQGPSLPIVSGAKVTRGGWGQSSLLECRSAYRNPSDIAFKEFYIGFRVVLERIQ